MSAELSVKSSAFSLISFARFSTIKNSKSNLHNLNIELHGKNYAPIKIHGVNHGRSVTNLDGIESTLSCLFCANEDDSGTIFAITMSCVS
jgi:hypothetical protein